MLASSSRGLLLLFRLLLSHQSVARNLALGKAVSLEGWKLKEAAVDRQGAHHALGVELPGLKREGQKKRPRNPESATEPSQGSYGHLLSRFAQTTR